MALGCSRLGNTSARAEFFDKITYNFGVGYKQLYYNVNNTDVNEYYGSLGFDIPVVGTTLINTAFTFGVRGENSGKNISETFSQET